MKIIKSKISRSGLYNTYHIHKEYIKLHFSNSEYVFIIDVDDFEKIKNYSWYPKPSEWGTYCSGYVNKKVITLHRFIMNAKPGEYIDHVDKNTFDNRKINLRFVTNQQNGFNRKIGKNNVSGVMGVRWDKRLNKWVARIKINYKNIHLGIYKNFQDAIFARLKAEKKYFKEFSPQRHLFKQYGIELEQYDK